jgi:transposase
VEVSRQVTRRHSRRATKDLRLQAVRLVEAGERAADVARLYGVSRAAVFRWTATFRQGGEAALNTRKAPGRAPLLSAEQRVRLRDMLLGLDPRERGFSRNLWTKAMVRQVVCDRFQVGVSQTSATRLLVGARLIPEPTEPSTVDDEAAGIARVADEYGATVVRFTSIAHDDGAALSATWPNRSAWFAFYKGACPASFGDFCRRLVADAGRPVLLVGAPDLRELVTVAHSLGGRLLLWPAEAGGPR